MTNKCSQTSRLGTGEGGDARKDEGRETLGGLGMSDPRKGFPASVMLADGRLTVEPYRPSGRLGVSDGSGN